MSLSFKKNRKEVDFLNQEKCINFLRPLTLSFFVVNNNRVSKNCLNWAQTYFAEQLVGLEAEKNGSKVKVTKIDEITGDCELNNRKSKIITIYDLQIKLNWEGKYKKEWEIDFFLLVEECTIYVIL